MAINGSSTHFLENCNSCNYQNNNELYDCYGNMAILFKK